MKRACQKRRPIHEREGIYKYALRACALSAAATPLLEKVSGDLHVLECYGVKPCKRLVSRLARVLREVDLIEKETRTIAAGARTP